MERILFCSLFVAALSFMSFANKGNYKNRPIIHNHFTESLGDGIVVLELFTSQGCSSCPPADVLLEMVNREYAANVFALSYHVDYWNYIGWKDPFSNPSFTKKQTEYNLKLKSRTNYTPQLFINAKEHLVGSDRNKVIGRIHEYSKIPAKHLIDLSGSKNGTEIVFEYGISGNLKDVKLRAVLVINERTTQVKRGENRNRILKNSNIVVAEKLIPASFSKGTGSITIPEMVTKEDHLTLILLAENENLGITGASKIGID